MRPSTTLASKSCPSAISVVVHKHKQYFSWFIIRFSNYKVVLDWVGSSGEFAYNPDFNLEIQPRRTVAQIPNSSCFSQYLPDWRSEFDWWWQSQILAEYENHWHNKCKYFHNPKLNEVWVCKLSSHSCCLETISHERPH